MKNLSLIGVINPYPYILLRLEGKINEGKRTTEKTKGTFDFHHLGPHWIYDTYPVNDRLDRIYGVFYGLSKTQTFKQRGSKTKPFQ